MAEPAAPFDDPRVQVVYEILCDQEAPPSGQHWEGRAARRIVDALADKVQPAMTDQQAEMLNHAHDMLLEHADAQRALGNDSAANSAECSADAVLKMAAAWSAAPPVAPAAPVAPQGWRWVPVEPTRAMLKAEPVRGYEMSVQRRPDVWAAMLAAAPPAPAAAPAEGARWLPIESAPREVPVLAVNGCGYVGRAIRGRHGRWQHIGKPIGWMPLPAAPTEAPNDQA